jgi:hypothetical protein
MDCTLSRRRTAHGWTRSALGSEIVPVPHVSTQRSAATGTPPPGERCSRPARMGGTATGHWSASRRLGTGQALDTSLRLALESTAPVSAHRLTDRKALGTGVPIKSLSNDPYPLSQPSQAAKMTQNPAWGPFRRPPNDLHAWYKPITGISDQISPISPSKLDR